MKHISSAQNQAVKNITALQAKSNVRKKSKTFAVEGLRELSLANTGGYSIITIYWCPEVLDKASFEQWQKTNTAEEVISVSLAVYRKIVVRETTEGVIGIVKQKEMELSQWKPKNNNPVVLILEAIEKPGNLGAILRSADATAVDAVILTEAHTDMYNPNVIRSSVGGFFSVQTFVSTNTEVKTFLDRYGFNVFAAALQKSVGYTTVDFTKATALVMGSEAHGLSAFWRNKTTAVKIPMLGQVDSLNVSVATAVLVYEVVRQRKT